MALGLPAPAQHTGLGASRELGRVLHLVGHLQQAQQHVDGCHWEPLRKTSDHGRKYLYTARVCKASGALPTHLRQALRGPQQSQAQGSSGRTLRAGPSCTGPAAQVNSQPWHEAVLKGTCAVTRSRKHSARLGRGGQRVCSPGAGL